MQFEDLDKKIREAAEQHHPAYDEKAWTKMQKLLNRHLPQARTDKRRAIILLFLLLFIGGGALFFIFRSNNSKGGPVSAGNEKSSVPVTTPVPVSVPAQTTGTAQSNNTPGSNSNIELNTPSN